SRYQGDCLFVDDALPESDDWPVRDHARTAIDRLSRTARDRTLFVSEVVGGGGRGLEATWRARHAPAVLTSAGAGVPSESALLLGGVVSVEALGGDRSAGVGACRIEVPARAVSWNGRPDYPLTRALAAMEEQDWADMVVLLREGGAA